MGNPTADSESSGMEDEDTQLSECSGIQEPVCTGGNLCTPDDIPHHSLQRSVRDVLSDKPLPPHGDSGRPLDLEEKKYLSLPVNIRGILHDARNVVTGVSGSLDMALKTLDGLCADNKGLADETAMQNLYNLLHIGKEASDTLMSILKSKRVESDVKKIVNMSDNLAHSINIIEAECVAKGIKIEAQIAPNCYIMAYSDVDLVRIFDNMLQNAIDSIERTESPVGIIKVNLSRDGTKIIVIIEDNGTGVNRSFRLSRPVSSKTGKDHGLGLGTIRDVIGKLGGNFTLVNNESGHGAYAVAVFDALTCISNRVK
jgi:signal transduction histidine kinase